MRPCYSMPPLVDAARPGFCSGPGRLVARGVSLLPAADVCQNGVGIFSAFNLCVSQLGDNAGHRLMHLGNLIPVFTVVLNHKGSSYTCENDNKLAR
jgi:hypothetical protein